MCFLRRLLTSPVSKTGVMEYHGRHPPPKSSIPKSNKPLTYVASRAPQKQFDARSKFTLSYTSEVFFRSLLPLGVSLIQKVALQVAMGIFHHCHLFCARKGVPFGNATSQDHMASREHQRDKSEVQWGCFRRPGKDSSDASCRLARSYAENMTCYSNV